MLELNKIYNIDCLEGMKYIDDKSIDMILCDLPYGTTKCKWDTIIPFDLLWEQYERIIKDSGAIVLTASQPFTSALIMSNPKLYRHSWIWNKKFAGNFANAKIQPMKIHEDILVFGKSKVNYYPVMIDRKKAIKGGGMTASGTTNYGINNQFKALKKNYDKKYPVSILDFPRILGKGNVHPTQKSLSLFEYLIRTYTNENEIVLDNCIGSGTTAIACINTNRNYIGFEWCPDEPHDKYFNIANKRIEEHKQNININT